MEKLWMQKKKRNKNNKRNKKNKRKKKQDFIKLSYKKENKIDLKKYQKMKILFNVMVNK